MSGSHYFHPALPGLTLDMKANQLDIKPTRRQRHNVLVSLVMSSCSNVSSGTSS